MIKKRVEMDNNGNSKYVIWLNEINKPVIPYLETHIMDSCNLNCKGCTHFPNLFDKHSKVLFKQLENDIKQVAQKSHVLRLLGGEPLLNIERYKYFWYKKKFSRCGYRGGNEWIVDFKARCRTFFCHEEKSSWISYISIYTDSENKEGN